MSETENIRILVAEDDREMLDLLTQVLSEEGYRVKAVSDGSAALKEMETGDFDLVLSDIRMPRASRLDVLERARASYLHQQ